MINEFELICIEALILGEEKPDYLEVSVQNNYLHILVAKKGYEHYSLDERYDIIYNIIKFEYPDIINRLPIIIETLDTKQLGDLFSLYGKPQ